MGTREGNRKFSKTPYFKFYLMKQRPAANVSNLLKCATSRWWIYRCLQNCIIACVKY